MKEPAKQRLNLFLLRSGSTLQDAIRDDVEGLKEYSLKSSLGFEGGIYTKAKAAKKPSWTRFVQEGTSSSIDMLLSQSSSAMVAMKVDSRVFCLVFGYARHWIPEHRIERRFGMITTLNCVDHESLRSVDHEEFEAISRTTRSQVSVNSNMTVFGVNPQRDLVRSVAGKPKDEKVGDFVAGSDNLILSAKLRFEDLATKCTQLLSLYELTDYQKAYPWIDNFKRVKSKSQVEKLDHLLVEQLRSGDHEKIFLSPPRLTDPSDPVVYRYPQEDDDADAHDDLRLSELLGINGVDHSMIDLQWLKKKKIREFSLSANQWIDQFSIYRATIFETKLDKDLYILSRGEWFAVALSYVQKVEKQIQSLQENTHISLPSALKSETEGKYNERAAKKSGNALFCLDAKSVSFGGGYSRIEVCDLLGEAGDFIHVKAKTKSSTLSHLFTQAVVSAQLMREPEFRALASKKASGKYVEILEPPSFEPKHLRVTLAIITSTGGDLRKALPFLSKQSLSNAVRELHLMGYSVFLNKIQAPA